MLCGTGRFQPFPHPKRSLHLSSNSVRDSVSLAVLTQRPLCGISAAAQLWGWIQPEIGEEISADIPAHP